MKPGWIPATAPTTMTAAPPRRAVDLLLRRPCRDSASLRFAATDRPPTDGASAGPRAQAAGGDAAGTAFVFGCGDMGQVRPARRRHVCGTPDFTG